MFPRLRDQKSIPVFVVCAGLMLLSTVALEKDHLMAALNIGPFTRQDVVPAPGVDFARVGDLDGDGRVDFIGIKKIFDRTTEDPNEVRVQWWPMGEPEPDEEPGLNFPRNGADIRGTPRGRETKLSIGDIDGDKNLDLLTYDVGSLGVWLNEAGDASFPRKSSGLGSNWGVATHIELANIDADSGDDLDDLVLMKEEGTHEIVWYRSESSPGDAKFDSRQTLARLGGGKQSATSFQIGDLNADGIADMVTVDKEDHVMSIWKQVIDGDERSFERIESIDERGIRDIVIADLDLDGHVDIVLSRKISNNAKYEAVAYLGRGDFGFEKQEDPLHEAGSGTISRNSIDAADINQDGVIDLVMTEFAGHSPNGHICWYENPLDPSNVEPTPTLSPTPGPTVSATTSPTASPTAIVDPSDTPVPSETPPSPSPTDGAEPSATPPATDETDPAGIIFLPSLERG